MRPVEVSVIMPVHNRADLLERSLRSALRQTYEALEVIAVDDGSTDGSFDVLQAIARTDERVRVLRRSSPSGGAATPRNLAIEQSRGSLVALLDDDDEWFLDKLERQLALFADQDTALVYSDVDVRRPDGVIEGTYWSLWNPPPAIDEDPIDALIDRNYVPAMSVVVRRSVLDRVGTFDPRRCPMEDYDQWLRVALGGSRLRRVDGCTGAYSWGERQLTGTITAADQQARLAAMYADLSRSHVAHRRTLSARARSARRAAAFENLKDALAADVPFVDRLGRVALAVAARPSPARLLTAAGRSLRRRVRRVRHER